ncbi:MAG: TlpA family protein disulfide reductase [Bacteroidota bacterium]|nr:TlpA family protein disulfide reductase [Bacteroidota bacterium]
MFKINTLNTGLINQYHEISVNYGLIKSGDSIIVSIVNQRLIFSGKGAEKFQILEQFRYIDDAWSGNVPIIDTGLTKGYFNSRDLITRKELSYLQSFKTTLNQDEFDLLKAFALSNYFDKSSYFYMVPDSAQQKEILALRSYHWIPPISPGELNEFNQRSILQYSDAYSNSIIAKYTFDSCYAVHKPFDIFKCYQFVESNFTGGFRERLIVNILYRHRKENADLQPLIALALEIVHNPDFIAVLSEIKQTHVKGAAAFNFDLPDMSGKRHQLGDYKGKAVFIDFWFTGCGNCMRVAPFLKEIEEKFQGKEVVFLSVNMDKNKKQWVNSEKTHKYTSPYVVNLFTEGQELNHPICKYYAVDGGPTLILIDKNGRLLNNPVDPRIDGGKNLIELINRELAAQD